MAGDGPNELAKPQRKIKPQVRRELVAEAGGKCANPGCPCPRVHVLHIKHWAIYKAHASEHMIALCPTCHDAAHAGTLKISDDVLYRWKGVDRPTAPAWAALNVEPAAGPLRVLTGSIALASAAGGAVAFELANANSLQFRVLDGDILQLSVRITKPDGAEILRVVENQVRVARGKEVSFDFRPGRARITVPANEDFFPGWALCHMRETANFVQEGRVPVLDLEVLEPGLVRAIGVWAGDGSAVIISQESIAFCYPTHPHPLKIVGEGATSCLIFNGAVTAAIFGVEPQRGPVGMKLRQSALRTYPPVQP